MLGHDDHVNSVAFADDSSNILITAGDDGIVSVSTCSNRIIKKLAPNGSWLVSLH